MNLRAANKTSVRERLNNGVSGVTKRKPIACRKGELLPDSATFGGLTLTEEPGGRHFLLDAVVFNPKTATCGVCGFGCLYPNSLFFDFAEINILAFELSNFISEYST
jgi:hypothetical protein